MKIKLEKKCTFKNSELMSSNMDDVLNRFLNSHDSKDPSNSVDELIKMAKTQTNKKSKPRPRLQSTTKDESVQAGIEVNSLAKDTVDKWLFTVSPQAVPPPKLQISESYEMNQFFVDKFSFEDDGTFQDDPIMRMWRKRINYLKKSHQTEG